MKRVPEDYGCVSMWMYLKTTELCTLPKKKNNDKEVTFCVMCSLPQKNNNKKKVLLQRQAEA